MRLEDLTSLNFTAIDFETANQSRTSAVSLGLVKVEKGKIKKKKVFLIKPPENFFIFTYIHGLTWDHVKDAPTFEELWPDIQPYFKGSDYLAAHNSPFDKGVLTALVYHYKLNYTQMPFVCTVRLARQAWDLFPTKLEDVARYLEIQLDHHEALSDAMACAKIVLAAGAPKFASLG